MDDLTRKRRVRGAHRASASKLVAKIVETIPRAIDEKAERDLTWLRQSQVTLREKVKRLKELDEQIIDILSASGDEDAEAQLNKEVESSDEAVAEFERTLMKIDDALRESGEQRLPLLTTPDEGNLDQSRISTASTGKIVRAKLPKLKLKNFNGKVCEWPEFWDGFSSSIDNNDALSDVDKFAYLRGYLEGPAKSTIAGLALTGTNYNCAVELLKKRFEKKSIVQRAHVNELIQLPAVYKERDTQRLRKLFDSCETNNRALRALGVNENSYSAIVVPTIMEKLPEQFRLTITRGQNSWSGQWRKCYKPLRKSSNYVKRTMRWDRGRVESTKETMGVRRRVENMVNNMGTASTLIASERKGNVLSA
ncbi:uncharacterized protein LOC114544218 [Dendronephthya gigantea]|uniref:uncharacterized protein LOC114544218 n=1 Tax=Dendronephthya gigantea TaxID=151771 RepID=UPI00106A5611|nr:uncharacterized protein LOC114544218 [Dendronephthya gigantea]